MVATALTPSEVQALYPTSASGQRDKRAYEAMGEKGKGIRREIGPGRTATTKQRT